MVLLLLLQHMGCPLPNPWHGVHCQHILLSLILSKPKERPKTQLCYQHHLQIPNMKVSERINDVFRSIQLVRWGAVCRLSKEQKSFMRTWRQASPDMWSTSNLQNTTLWIANLDRDPKKVKKVCECYKCLLYFPIKDQVIWGNNTVCSVRAWNDKKSMEFPTERWTWRHLTSTGV